MCGIQRKPRVLNWIWAQVNYLKDENCPIAV